MYYFVHVSASGTTSVTIPEDIDNFLCYANDGRTSNVSFYINDVKTTAVGTLVTDRGYLFNFGKVNAGDVFKMTTTGTVGGYIPVFFADAKEFVKLN